MHYFRAVELGINTDIDKDKYLGYEVGFDGHGFFSHPSGRTGGNVIIFGVGMNSSSHIDNKGKEILILRKVPTQGLGEHSLTAGKIIPLILLKLIQNFF